MAPIGIYKFKSQGSLILFVAILSVAAQLNIEIGQFLPITGQTLALLSMSFFMTPLHAGMACILYMLLGILGLPVFAEFSAGWAIFSGSSFGYLLGFILAAIFISYLSIRKIGILKIFLFQIGGHLVILLLGSFFLLRYLPLDEAFLEGFFPFCWGAIVKSFLGTLLVLAFNRILLLSRR